MNVVNAKADAHDESDARVKNEESGNWHKRLRLRKNSFSFSTLEKNTVKQEKKQTNQKRARKATETSENPEGVQNDRAVDRSERNKHTFCCSACEDGTMFRPGEFIVHYKNIHAGKAPVFPCDMCGFSTTVFSTLQRHRITHKDCLFHCEVCKDDIQHTFSQLIQHCQSQHSLKGQFHCQTCQISVKNIEQFVFHLCPPTTDHDENMTNGTCKSGPLTDAVGSVQKEDLLKHLAATFRQRWRRRKWWRKRKPATKADDNPSQEFKFLKAEPQWVSLPISAAGLLDNHGVLLDPEKTLEETQQFLERTVSYGKKWPVFLKTEQDVRKAGKDKLTGLMEKNNLCVPPDCTTKFVGFKMVDGKKHVVLKVIPSSKRDISAPKKSKDVESETFSHTPNHQTQVNHEHSNTVLISTNCSLFPTEKQRQCEDERGKRRGDGQHTRVSTHIRHSGNEFNLNVANHQNTKELRGDCTSDSRAVLKQVFPSEEERVYCPDLDRVKETPEESVYDNHLTSSHSGSSEDTCHLQEQSPAQASDITDEALGESASENTDSCIHSGLISEFDLCECGVGDVLFHSSVDESTNNTDPRDAQFPVGQRDGEKGTYSSAAHQLPLTTVRHLLDEADRLTSHAAAESREHDVSPTSPNESGLNRKRVVEVLLKDSEEPVSKSQKRSAPEESDVLQRESVPPDVPRSLRLRPFGSSQSITIPRDNQPVVVLNHPDADIQEVTNIMKVVHKHKGAVRRVVLSGKTLSALSDCRAAGCGRAWPDGTVKERFSLKLRLKRVCGRKFTVVPTVWKSVRPQPTFRCWFCGRLFQNQEVWVGHGQRHLTEATRGWNQLFHR